MHIFQAYYITLLEFVSLLLILLHSIFLNRDYLIAGALLHDIGKTVELSSAISPSYTTEGNLLGHISDKLFIFFFVCVNLLKLILITSDNVNNPYELLPSNII